MRGGADARTAGSSPRSPSEHIKSQGIDPADYVDADDLGRLLEDEFTIELRAVKPRIDPPPDSPHIADVVLRARRR